jgi:hypothetical protein
MLEKKNTFKKIKTKKGFKKHFWAAEGALPPRAFP